MGIRSRTADAIRTVGGSERLEQLRRLDTRARRAAIGVLDVEARHHGAGPDPAPDTATVDPAARRLERIQELGEGPNATLATLGPEGWPSADPLAKHPRARRQRHYLLNRLHQQLVPRTYLEVGVSTGLSLQLSRTKTIAVDPSYHIDRPIQCDLRAFVATSDDFFAREDAFEHFGGTGVDLAFIDGMHRSEYVLRDFLNAERHVAPGGVVVLDDMLPRNDLEAYRIRRTFAWTGDVYKVLDVLREHRPDLIVLPVNTKPTGTVVILGCDPTSTVLADRYAEIEATLTEPDPQRVPPSVLHRDEAVDPDALLDSDVWSRAVALREAGGDHAAFTELYRELRDLPRYGSAG